MWRSTGSPAALIAAAVVCVCLNADGSRLEDDPMVRGWMDHVISFSTHLQKDVLAESASADNRTGYNFKLQWFNQRLDHINRQQLGRWWQRYYVYDKFSRLEQNYPLFVFCGGEQGDIFQEWNHLGFVLEVARAHGAKVMWLEHRFFGSSMPFKGAEAFATRLDRVGLLSLEQSMEDYAEIIREHRGEGPVLTFGGSLSGTIASMMRIHYPTLVDMAYASSAPVLGYDGVADPFAWRKRLTDNFAELGDPGCPDAVRRGFAAVAAAMVNPDSETAQKLQKAVRSCEKKPTGPQWQILNSMAWAELERLGNYVYPQTLSGINASCQRMQAVSSAEEVFPALLMLGASAPQKYPAPGYPCLSFSDLQAGAQPSSPVGVGWSYMACTEVIHPIGANNKTDMFPPYEWTVDGLTASCKPNWHVIPDAHYLQHKLGVEVEGTGANATVRRSADLPGRILFTYGDLDPWGTMVPKEGWADSVKILKVHGGSHCSDLETPRPEDSEDMIKARKQIAAVLSEWIQEVQKMRVMKVNSFGHAAEQPLEVQRFGAASKLRGGKAQTLKADSASE